MKTILCILLSIFFLETPLDTTYCSPVRTPSSEWVWVHPKSEVAFVKGYYLPFEGGKERLAKFKVVQSSNHQYQEGTVYPVYEYGPFGSECELYEMGTSPLADSLCGPHQVRFLIHYANKKTSDRIVTPIFHEQGLRFDAEDNIVYDYKEQTDATAFEAYIFNGSSVRPTWTAVPKE